MVDFIVDHKELIDTCTARAVVERVRIAKCQHCMRPDEGTRELLIDLTQLKEENHKSLISDIYYLVQARLETLSKPAG